ncbi:MAG: hypothetical protein JO334_09270 [Verrucomicrobia bacterium]|nr:hypothetical protein [Verrucomicrobiota bacterium]
MVKTAPALPDKALVLQDQLIASFFTGPKNKYERTFSGKLNAMDLSRPNTDYWQWKRDLECGRWFQFYGQTLIRKPHRHWRLTTMPSGGEVSSFANRLLAIVDERQSIRLLMF